MLAPARSSVTAPALFNFCTISFTFIAAMAVRISLSCLPYFSPSTGRFGLTSYWISTDTSATRSKSFTFNSSKMILLFSTIKAATPSSSTAKQSLARGWRIFRFALLRAERLCSTTLRRASTWVMSFSFIHVSSAIGKSHKWILSGASPMELRTRFW